MLESSSDWKGKGHSLGYYITTELQLWIKEHPAVQQVSKRESKSAGRKERAIDFNVPQVSPVSLDFIVQHLLCSLIQTQRDEVWNSYWDVVTWCVLAQKWNNIRNCVVRALFPLPNWDYHLSRSNHFGQALISQPLLGWRLSQCSSHPCCQDQTSCSNLLCVFFQCCRWKPVAVRVLNSCHVLGSFYHQECRTWQQDEFSAAEWWAL